MPASSSFRSQRVDIEKVCNLPGDPKDADARQILDCIVTNAKEIKSCLRIHNDIQFYIRKWLESRIAGTPTTPELVEIILFAIDAQVGFWPENGANDGILIKCARTLLYSFRLLRHLPRSEWKRPAVSGLFKCTRNFLDMDRLGEVEQNTAELKAVSAGLLKNAWIKTEHPDFYADIIALIDALFCYPLDSALFECDESRKSGNSTKILADAREVERILETDFRQIYAEKMKWEFNKLIKKLTELTNGESDDPQIQDAIAILARARLKIAKIRKEPYLTMLDCWEAVSACRNSFSYREDPSIYDIVDLGVTEGLRFLSKVASGDSEFGGNPQDSHRYEGHFKSRLGDLLRERYNRSTPEKRSILDLNLAIENLKWSMDNGISEEHAIGFNLTRIAECLFKLERGVEAEKCLEKVGSLPDSDWVNRPVRWQAFRRLGILAGRRADIEASIGFFQSAFKIWEPASQIDRNPTVDERNIILHSDLCEAYAINKMSHECIQQAKFYLGFLEANESVAADRHKSRVLSFAIRAESDPDAMEQMCSRYLPLISKPQWRLRPLALVVLRHSSDTRWRKLFAAALESAAKTDPIIAAVLGNERQKSALMNQNELFGYLRDLGAKQRAGAARWVIEQLRPFVQFRRNYWVDAGRDHPEIMILFGICNRMIGDIDASIGTLLYSLQLVRGDRAIARVQTEIGLCYELDGRLDAASDWFLRAFQTYPHGRSLEGMIRCGRRSSLADRTQQFIASCVPGRRSLESFPVSLIREFRYYLATMDDEWKSWEPLFNVGDDGTSLWLTLLERCIGPDLQPDLVGKAAGHVLHALTSKDSSSAGRHRTEALLRIANRLISAAYFRGDRKDCRDWSDSAINAILDLGDDRLHQTAVILGSARDSALLGSLWRYANAGKEAFQSDPENAIRAFNRVLTGADWKKFLPGGWRNLARLPAQSVLEASAARMSTICPLIDVSAAGYFMSLEDAFFLRHEFESAIRSMFGPSSSIAHHRVSKMVWNFRNGVSEIDVIWDLRSYVDSCAAWGTIMAAIVEQLRTSDPNGVLTKYSFPEEGTMRIEFTKTLDPLPPLPGQRWQEFDSYLNCSQIDIINGGEPDTEFFGKLESRIPIELPESGRLGRYFHYWLDQSFALCISSIFGLAASQRPSAFWHPSFDLHPLKEKVRRWCVSDRVDLDVRNEVEEEFAQAYWRMARGFLGGRSDNGMMRAGLAASVDNVVDEIVASRQWSPDALARRGTRHIYLAVSPATLRHVLEPLLDNAFCALHDSSGSTEKVTLVLETFDEESSGSSEGGNGPHPYAWLEVSNSADVDAPANPESTGIGIPAAKSSVERAGGTWHEAVTAASGSHCQSFTLPMIP